MLSSGDYNHCYIDNSGSGFTAGRSTADAILALRLLSELYRKFAKHLHVAYVYIKAAFDSMDRETLWNALHVKHVPPFLISLIKDLHTGTKSTSYVQLLPCVLVWHRLI